NISCNDYVQMSLQIFKGKEKIKMKIEYCILSDKGKIRNENQDRIFVSDEGIFNNNKEYLFVHRKSDVKNGTVFAVFDGIGGELCGSDASQIAVDTMISECKNNKICNMVDLCFKMNRNICEFMFTNRIKSMGTTAAMLQLFNDEFKICNIGDSRIYAYSNNELFQLTTDHTVNIGRAKKRRVLTQFLGIPETEFEIKPFECDYNYSSNDIFLVCSDGLTDLVKDEKIKDIISSNDLSSACEKLYRLAIQNGGRDNISIILCKLLKD
ncbi:MAG: serine/threonine-protein phosphatase, partial [Ruminococcus sp.]|nr:serine/threonine-protein phosphatase [Candidatus Copronaster equi]